jgi:hypothetical protein
LDIKGTTQNLKPENVRDRSAAFPFEIPYRLINMYSIKCDTVLDPFLGTGTTMLAAIAAGRNSTGYEVEPDFQNAILQGLSSVLELSNQKITSRLDNHLAFVNRRLESGGELKYKNKSYGFPVMTSQETELLFNPLESIEETGKNTFKVNYSDNPQEKYDSGAQKFSLSENSTPPTSGLRSTYSSKKEIQRRLFD